MVVGGTFPLVAVMTHRNVIVDVAFLLAGPHAALDIDFGIPLRALADADGALRDAEAVGLLIEGGMEGAVALGIVEVCIDVHPCGQSHRQMVVERPTSVAGAVEGLGDGRWRIALDETLCTLGDGLVVSGGGVLGTEGLFDFLVLVALVLVVDFSGHDAGGEE